MNIVLTLLSYPLYLRYLGYEQFGVWLLLSTIVAFIQLTNLGLGPALTSLVAEAKGRGDTAAVEGYSSSAGTVLLLVGLLAASVAWIASNPVLALARLQGEPLRIATRLFPWAGLLSVTALLAQASTGVLAGLGRIDVSNYLDSCSRLVALAVSLVLLRSGWKVEALISGAIVAQLLLVSGAQLATSQLCGMRSFCVVGVKTQWLAQLWLRASGLTLGSAVGLLIHPFNRFAMARWSGIESVPVYEIAYSGAMQIRSVFEAGGRALVPAVSQARGAAGSAAVEQIERLQWRVTRLFLLAAGPIFLISAFGADPFLRLLLRDGYQEGIASAFRIMLFGSFMSLMGVPSFYVAIGLGRSRIVAIGQSIIASVNVCAVIAWVRWSRGLSSNTVSAVVTLALAMSTLYYIVATRQAIANMRRCELPRIVVIPNA